MNDAVYVYRRVDTQKVGETTSSIDYELLQKNYSTIAHAESAERLGQLVVDQAGKLANRQGLVLYSETVRNFSSRFEYDGETGVTKVHGATSDKDDLLTIKREFCERFQPKFSGCSG